MKKNVITPMRRAIRCGITFILLICGMCQPALAEEQSLLTLLFNDGHKQSYVLASRPKVTFDSSTLYVASDDVKDEYVLADVSQFVFDKGDVTAIAAVKDGECRLTFVDGATVEIEGIGAATTVRLYDASGKSIAATKADANGKAVVSLASCQNGMYVVSVDGGKSYKVIKNK